MVLAAFIGGVILGYLICAYLVLGAVRDQVSDIKAAKRDQGPDIKDWGP